jgi:hypothetical protein
MIAFKPAPISIPLVNVTTSPQTIQLGKSQPDVLINVIGTQGVWVNCFGPAALNQGMYIFPNTERVIRADGSISVIAAATGSAVNCTVGKSI